MTTLAHQNAIPEPKLTLVKGGVTNSDNSGSITQGGINPSAAAMLILYQVMAMYAQITGINAQEQKSQIKAQRDVGQAEAHATVKAGEWAGKTMIIGAAAGMAGALIGLGITFKASAEMKANSDKTKILEDKIAPAKSIEKMDSEITLTKLKSGEDNPKVTNRALELEQGRYEGDANLNLKAVKKLRQDPKKYQAFRDRLDGRIGTFEKARNSYASDSQGLMQKQSTIGTTVNTVGGSLNSMSQGFGQWKKAGHDADASLQRSANAMAQQTASSQADAARKAGEAQNAVVNVLNAIRQASSNV